MFGHLKAEDFMNLMEGTSLTQKRLAHLESCSRCAETLKSVETVRNQMASTQETADEHILEPDWTEFRGDVRNALFARSVKRESTNRNWLGGVGWKPAAAWGFSLVLVFGIMTSVVLRNHDDLKTNVAETVAGEDAIEPAGTINAIASISQPDVFDDLLQLDERETESLRVLLEDLTQKGVSRQ